MGHTQQTLNQQGFSYMHVKINENSYLLKAKNSIMKRLPNTLQQHTKNTTTVKKTKSTSAFAYVFV
jgi:hypothetical protein